MLPLVVHCEPPLVIPSDEVATYSQLPPASASKTLLVVGAVLVPVPPLLIASECVRVSVPIVALARLASELKRLVEDAVVEKKLVLVACEVVAFFAVKFCSVDDASERKPPLKSDAFEEEVATKWSASTSEVKWPLPVTSRV